MPVPVDSFLKTVSTAGSQEVLTSSTIYVSRAIFKGLAGNSNNVYIGGSDVSSVKYPIDANEVVIIDAPSGPGGVVIGFNLADVWVDVDTNGEGLDVMYVQVG